MRFVAKGGDFGGKARGIVAYKLHCGYSQNTKKTTSSVMNAGAYWDYFATLCHEMRDPTKTLENLTTHTSELLRVASTNPFNRQHSQQSCMRTNMAQWANTGSSMMHCILR